MKYFWLGAAVITVTIIGAVCFKSLAGPLNADFTMFWNLKELAYPPPYLLFIKPLTLMPYGAAFILWVAGTGALYLWASRNAKLLDCQVMTPHMEALGAREIPRSRFLDALATAQAAGHSLF